MNMKGIKAKSIGAKWKNATINQSKTNSMVESEAKLTNGGFRWRWG